MKSTLKLFLAGLFSFTSSFLQAQAPELSWAFQTNTSPGNHNATGIAADPSGNVFTAGYYTGSVDLDPGTGVAQFASAGIEDAYLAKYDNDGNYLWGFSLGDSGYDRVYDVVADDSGNVFICGFFQDTVDFDPGPGSYYLTAHWFQFSATCDGFIAKYTASGALAWVIQLGGTISNTSCFVQALSIDGSGNICATGESMGNSIDFDPGPGNAGLTGGFGSCFLAKYTNSGSYIFALNLFTWQFASHAADVAASTGDKICLIGALNDTTDMDPLGPGHIVNIPSAMSILFVAQYSESGLLEWVFLIPNYTLPNGIYLTYVYDAAYDPDGNVILTGQFPINVDLDPSAAIDTVVSVDSSYDAFIAKYDPAGNHLWSFSFGNTGNDAGIKLCTDDNGNIYVTGAFMDMVDFDPGPASYIMGSSASTVTSDVCVIRYSPAGNFQWGFSLQESSNWDIGRGIAVLNDDIFVAGDFYNTIDFDPSGGIANVTAFATGRDNYVAKYVQDSTIGIISSEPKSLFVYPNPASQTVFIELGQNTTCSCQLLNVAGEVLSSETQFTERIRVDVSMLPEGVYFVRIFDGPTETNVKIIVSH